MPRLKQAMTVASLSRFTCHRWRTRPMCCTTRLRALTPPSRRGCGRSCRVLQPGQTAGGLQRLQQKIKGGQGGVRGQDPGDRPQLFPDQARGEGQEAQWCVQYKDVIVGGRRCTASLLSSHYIDRLRGRKTTITREMLALLCINVMTYLVLHILNLLSIYLY